MTTVITVMSGELGDIFWDLPPWVVYSAGYDVGCSIYVANPTETEKEYALMARLSSNETVISEEALPVFGQTSAAHIANGLGGTINLICSVILVALLMFGMGFAAWRSTHLRPDQSPETFVLCAAAVTVGFAVLTGAAALLVGARHFERVEV